MTLSLAGRCDRTGKFGVIIASSSPAVAARCAWVRAGIGAVCTQNITDPRLGKLLLDEMASGYDAEAAVAAIVQTEPLIAFRQVTAIDRNGKSGSYSGLGTLGIHDSAHGEQAVAAGNILANGDVPRAMVQAFERASAEDLGDRLLAAIVAGIEAGGEVGPVRSAGMLIAGAVSWAETDLRVDWSDDPIAELSRVWYVWKPQVADYLQRALNPDQAPSYGVPGDTGR